MKSENTKMRMGEYMQLATEQVLSSLLSVDTICEQMMMQVFGEQWPACVHRQWDHYA